jgi:hypothetical protein
MNAQLMRGIFALLMSQIGVQTNRNQSMHLNQPMQIMVRKVNCFESVFLLKNPCRGFDSFFRSKLSAFRSCCCLVVEVPVSGTFQFVITVQLWLIFLLALAGMCEQVWS